MSILIKGLKMPTNCPNCFASDDESRFCRAAKKYIPMLGKPKFCPLIELPDHGRLIDADALDTSILREGFSYALTRRKLRYTAGDVRQKIAYAPTVIPEDRKDGE